LAAGAKTVSPPRENALRSTAGKNSRLSSYFPFSKALFWHYPHYSNQGGTPNGTIRDGDWKLIEWYEDGALELYNIPQDIGEKNNLATQNPDKAKELHSKLIAWRKEVGALMPTPNSASTSVKNPNKKKRAK
jgi:hypothetical protein